MADKRSLGSHPLVDPFVTNGDRVAWPEPTNGDRIAWPEPSTAIEQNREPGWTEVAEVVSNDAGGLLPAEEKPHVANPLSFFTRLTYSLPAFSTTSLTILISLYVNDFYGMHQP
jgi:hypothetical protein